MATRLLISGADGLIGRHCLPLLRVGGAQPRSIEEVVPGIDLLEPGATQAVLDAGKPDVVLHLAWVASSTPGYRNHPDNPKWQRATSEWARLCMDRSIGFVGTGTVAEVDSPGIDAYTSAKVATWQDLRRDVAKGRITWLRPHFVFDPEIGRPEAMAEINRSMVENRNPDLRSPQSAHDFIHVGDVASAIALVLSARIAGLVPVGSGRLHTVGQLARAAGAQGYEPADPPRHPDPLHTADTTTLAAFGWRPHLTEEYFHV